MKFVNPYEALKQKLDRIGDRVALGALRLGPERYSDFRKLSWYEVYLKVKQYGLVLRSQGLVKGDRVGIISRNQAAWVLLDWACFANGMVPVPMYPQSTREDIDYIVKEAELKLLVCEKPLMGLPTKIMSFEELEVQSLKFKASEHQADPLEADEVSTLIYTSGTTGEPKGVMHTARNIQQAVEEANVVVKLSPEDRLFSYLPLSHVAERLLNSIGPLYTGASAYYIDQVEKASRYLTEVRPTVFFAVPRIWDMMMAKIDRELEQKPPIKKVAEILPTWIQAPTLGKLVRSKIGLDKARILVSGAAKLNPETAQRLKAFGVNIVEAYGLTETFCVTSMNDPRRPSVGNVGYPFSSVQVKIAEDGEIVVKAPFHFTGYYKKPEETAKVLRDGWFKTGDIGSIDSLGRIKITDRKKDIFKTTNGKYVAPLPIESKLKTHPAIQEVMVVGENKPYCVAVAALNEEGIDEVEMESLLEQVNSKLAQHERVHSIVCTHRPWSVDAGELTPSMKLKRRKILESYGAEIEDLYQSRTKIKYLDSSDPVHFAPQETSASAHSRV